MITFILLVGLWSGNGGVAIEKVEFTGVNAEANCEKAADKWRHKMDSFSVTGQAFCSVK